MPPPTGREFGQLLDFLSLVQPAGPGLPSAFPAARSLTTPINLPLPFHPPASYLLSLISSTAGWPALQRLDLQLDCGKDNGSVDVTAELQQALLLLPSLRSLTISRIALRNAAITFLCSLPLTELLLEGCDCYDVDDSEPVTRPCFSSRWVSLSTPNRVGCPG